MKIIVLSLFLFSLNTFTFSKNRKRAPLKYHKTRQMKMEEVRELARKKKEQEEAKKAEQEALKDTLQETQYGQQNSKLDEN